MSFAAGTAVVALGAGALSTLSPCVLPIAPILLSSAASAHRLGVVALTSGLALSFALIGTLLGALGPTLGIDETLLHQAGAILLILFGLVLLIPSFQAWFSKQTRGLAGTGNLLLSRISGNGLIGQFLIGAILALAWAPCSGPTLGAAATLAGQQKDLLTVALVMLFFGFGAALPLALIGSLSREVFARSREKLAAFAHHAKLALGVFMLAFGIAILTGYDHLIEGYLVDHSPDWLTSITTAL